MFTTSNNKVRSRTSSAHRLIAVVFLTILFNLAVFAQAAPTLTLVSNVSIFNFGRFNTGTLSPNTVITISNGGTVGTVLITGVSITGANAGDFTLVGTTCVNATLTTVGTCTATIRFNPLAIGVRTANLTVTDNAAGSQHLVPLRGTGLNPAIPNKAVGPIDPRIGYPLWYRDELGKRLTLCLDASGNCVAPDSPFNPLAPASVTTASPINFPEEAFYSYADARITRPSGGQVRLVITTEAAFTTAGPVVGQQITFERIRVRVDQLTPGAVYTITHPFGVMTATANADGGIIVNSALKVTATASTSAKTVTTTPVFTGGAITALVADPTVTDIPVDTTTAVPTADGTVVVAAKGPGGGGGGGGGGTNTAEINTTEDIGCGSSPCDFRASLDGRISRFLSWDTGAPAGYIGNPNVLHTITGSPFATPTNYFRVDGPNVGGVGINTVQTNLFTIAGKLFQ